MSLFKAREWWSTNCGNEEQFDGNSLLVAKLNSDYDYVIVGSLSGVLRIYQPGPDKQDDGRLNGYRATDLIIEMMLPHPVLQISTGRLVSGSQIMQLAVLHPRSVAIYSLVSKSGVIEHGTQNNLLQVYEHPLKRSTFNLTVGQFGGSQHRDFICVQSLDGMLTFFEQEIFSFCCFLPDTLLPGPLVFVRSSDSFVTINSNWEIASFSYKRLSENSQNSNLNDTTGVKFDSDWSYNIGENILDLRIIETEINETFLIVLGEHNLFTLNDNGKLIYMKRFDFSPQCFQPYYIRSHSKIMCLVVTETNTLLIYDRATLKWSAQLPFLPIAIGRAFFGCLSGALILLSDTGLLQFSYLGTEPQLFTAPPLQNQELDFEKAELELNTLNKIIKSNRTNDITLTNAATERELNIAVIVNPHLEKCTFENDVFPDEDTPLLMCLVSVELMPNAPFEEVQIALNVDVPLEVRPAVHFINNLEDKSIFDSYVYLAKPLEVSSLQLNVIVSHITTTGQPRILRRNVQLPLKLVAIAEVPAKDAAHKITLNINEAAAPLSALFPEFAGEQSFSVSSSAIGFKNVAGIGSIVSILLAKSSQRYRLQSDSLASLNLYVEQLVLRLTKHFEKKSDFKITHTSSLPMGQFLDVIEGHFDKRILLTNLQNQLNELSAQFRLIQKRLITKFKDKNPTPINNLDTLMFQTYSEIIECSENIQTQKKLMLKVQCELACVIRLIMLLLKHSDVPSDNFKLVNAMFVTPINDIDGQGWEDVIELCMSHLMRTVLSKSEKDKLKNISNSLEPIKDIKKFKKRVAQLLDRLTKSVDEPTSNESKEDETAAKMMANTAPEVTQVGSRIAVSSARAQSARMRTKLLSTPEENEEDVV